MGLAPPQRRPVGITDRGLGGTPQVTANNEARADQMFAGDMGELDSVRGHEIDGHLCFPVVCGDGYVGVLGAPTPAEDRADLERRLAVVATLVGLAARNMHLLTEIEEHGVYDGLTRCFNRTHGMKLLVAELKRAKRARTDFSLVMFDLDFFKSVNDEYGHLCGDALLAAVGKRLTTLFRNSDIRVRYGGEEFMILLPDTNLFMKSVSCGTSLKCAKHEDISVRTRALSLRSMGLRSLLAAEGGPGGMARWSGACHMTMSPGCRVPGRRSAIFEAVRYGGEELPPKQIGGDAGFETRGGRHPRSAPPRDATRAAATSGRSCSDGRTGFFNGQAEGPHGAPDRRHTRGRGEGVLQLSQRAIRVRRSRPRCVGAAQMDARRHLAVAGFKSRTRSRGGPHRPPSSRHRCRGRPAPAQIHRIGTHRSSCIGARRSTTTAPGSTRPI